MGFFMFTNVPAAEVQANFKQYSKLYYMNGIVLIILGVFALFAPVVAATLLALLIGCMLLLTGIVQGIFSFSTRGHWTYYLTAALAIIAGTYMLVQPNVGVMAIGAVVLVYLVLQGFFQLVAAVSYSKFSGWAWLLFSGIVSLLLAGMIIASWPISAAWILGLMIGVNFITFGIAIMMVTKYIND